LPRMLIAFDSLRDSLTAARGSLRAGCREHGAQGNSRPTSSDGGPVEAPIPDPAAQAAAKASPHHTTGLSRWARENPAAFAGLWFAGAAGLLAAQALIFLPTLVAEARELGGASAWRVGAVALAHVYLSPSLLALVLGSFLGASVVSPGYPDGQAPAVRGALVGAISLVIWVLIGTALLHAWSIGALVETSEAPLGAAAAVGLVLLLLLVPFLIVSAVGAGAGYLLHALTARSPRAEASGAGQPARLES
jgi:hypothetical protein